jgi:hypothetical protein
MLKMESNGYFATSGVMLHSSHGKQKNVNLESIAQPTADRNTSATGNLGDPARKDSALRIKKWANGYIGPHDPG